MLITILSYLEVDGLANKSFSHYFYNETLTFNTLTCVNNMIY